LHTVFQKKIAAVSVSKKVPRKKSAVSKMETALYKVMA